MNDKFQNKKKEVVVLSHNKGRLANQLWNFAAVYAYCEDRDYKCSNPSFFEYTHYFDGLYSGLPVWCKVLNLLSRIKVKGNRLIPRTVLYWLYYPYRFTNEIFFSGKKIDISDQGNFSLPPADKPLQIQEFEISSASRLYLSGWPYRNKKGLKKYRKTVNDFFSVEEKYCLKGRENIDILKRKYDNVIGLMIRRGDYRTWNGGKYFYDDADMNEILEKFLQKNEMNKRDTVFLITSDEEVNINNYQSFNVVVNGGNAIEDLFALSKSDEVLGVYSSFVSFASYLGNIPFTMITENKLLKEFKDGSDFFG